MQRIALGLLALATCFLFSGCSGYRLGPAKPEDLAHIQKLAIPVFVNKTLEPRLAVPLTNATIKEFQNDTSYEIASMDEADAALIVEIKQIKRSSFRFNRSNRLISRELMFTVVCEFYVEDLINGDLLLEGKATGRSNLGIADNFQLTERQALTDAGRALAIQIMSKVSEGW